MAMRKSKKAKLEAAGWRVGTAAEFLKLSKEEAALIELLGPLLVANDSIFKDSSQKGLLDQYGLGLPELLALQDLGLLSGVASVGGINKTFGVDEQHNLSLMSLCSEWNQAKAMTRLS